MALDVFVTILGFRTCSVIVNCNDVILRIYFRTTCIIVYFSAAYLEVFSTSLISGRKWVDATNDFQKISE